jgi:F-type H+-transporting ATPase subunit delta
MKIPKQARRGAKELFKSCLVNGVLDEGRVRQAVQKTIAVEPRGYVAVLSHFQRLVKLELERRTARIESATPLSPELQTSVQDSLLRTYGPGLSLSFCQNPGLLGGMRVQVGSDVYDGSIQARLEELRESF